MIIVKHVKMLVPSELVYAFDPTSEDLFVIAREKGRLTARPVSECGFINTNHTRRAGNRQNFILPEFGMINEEILLT